MDFLNKYSKINIANWSVYLFLFLVILATGCETVVISTEDSEPPSFSLSVLQSIGKLRSVTASSPSTEDLEFEVAPEENISFLAVAFDPNGPKSIRIRVISGGQIEINAADETLLVTDYTFNQEVVGGTTNNRFGVGGSCKFSSPDENMIIQAETEDFAGNIATAPKITLVQKNKVIATFTRSAINRGAIYDNVALNWQIQNANTAYLIGPPVFTGRFPIRMNDGISPNVSESFSVTLIAENSVSLLRITLNVSYSNPGAPEILRFSTDPSTIVEGGSSTISWSVLAGDPTIVNIEPGVYDGYEREGSRIVSPRTSQNYTLTAWASGNRTIDNKEITVLPRCWSTPNRDLWWGGSFEFRGFVAGWRFWDMELSHILPDSYVISTVTNRNSVLVKLWSGGRYVELEPGESSNFFDGLTVTRGWTLESPGYIAFPNIEFCFRG